MFKCSLWLCKATIILSISCGLPLQISFAQNSQPIHVTNNLPVMLGSGLSAPKSSDLMVDDKVSIDLFWQLQSHANDAASGTEGLLIDGEVQSLGLIGRWNFTSRWQLGIEFASIKHKAGSLDSAIRQWHDIFGLTQGDRDNLPDDQFLYQYQNPDSHGEGAFARLDSPVSGISDTQVSLAYQLYSDHRINAAAYLSALLSTGDSAKVTGSEKTDYKFSLALGSNSKSAFGWHVSGDIIKIGDEQLFSIATKNTTWASSAGIHWQGNQQWRWSAQLDGHGRIFESDIDEINRDGWQLSLALQYQAWQIYFAEDLSVNRAADFSIGLNWRAEY